MDNLEDEKEPLIDNNLEEGRQGEQSTKEEEVLVVDDGQGVGGDGDGKDEDDIVEDGMIAVDDDFTFFERFYARTGFGRRLFMPWGFLPYFNILLLAVLLGGLAYNFFVISSDYANQLDNPPIHLESDVTIPTFPNVVACSMLVNVSIQGATVCIRHLENNSFVECCGNSCQEPYKAPEPKMHSVKNSLHGGTNFCLFWNMSTVPSFVAYPGGVGFGATEVTYELDIQSNLAAPTDKYLGAKFFISSHDYSELNEYTQFNAIQQNFDGGHWYAGAGQKTFSNFRSSMVKWHEGEKPSLYYDVVVSSVPANTANSSDVAQRENFVESSLSFRTAQTQVYTQKPMSFSVYFGSVGGWVGILSDGWGLLSLTFLLEKMLTRLLGVRHVVGWTDRVNEKVERWAKNKDV